METKNVKNAFDVKDGSILTNVNTKETYEVLERLQYFDPLYWPPLFAYKIKNINTNEVITIKVEDYETYGIENWDIHKTKDGKPWL